MNSSSAGLGLVVSLGLVIAATIWVGVDARKRNMAAGGWAAGTLLLFVVFFPLYLVVRRRNPVVPTAHAPTPVAVPGGFPAKSIALTVVLVFLGVLYASGRMDPTLYKIGLNLNTCGQNAFGAVFCGDALTEYNQRIEDAKRSADQAAQQAQQQAQDAERQAQGNAAAQAQQLQAQQSDQAALCAADPTAYGC